MKDAPNSIDKRCILLGEGEEEVEFFSALLLEMDLADQVQVLPYRGKSKLAAFLSTLPALRGFDQVKRIAITRDADDDPAGAIASVDSVVNAASEEVRSHFCGRFILPDNANPGALEALWLASLEGSPYSPCVEQFFACIQNQGWTPSQTFAKNDKARAQVFIATFDTPNDRFGHAAWHGRKDPGKPWMREKWIDFDHPAFDALKQFLREAFEG